MTRRTFDPDAVEALLRENDRIATHAQLRALGMPIKTIARWASRGPWQRVLPGVVAGHRGTLSRRQRRLGALAYCGPAAVLSGEHALEVLGVTGDRIAIGGQILVLIPWTRKRLSTGFVTVERTQREATTSVRRGLPVVPPARAAADAARHGADLERIREIFGATLHQRRCTVEELRDEVLDGPTQRTADARLVLSEVSAGVRSTAEATVLRAISAAGLPQPLWNETVVVNGLVVGEADAYWPELGVALEVDGIRWHSTPHDIRRTQAKQRAYAETGILLVSIAPADVLADLDGFLRQLGATLAVAARRVG
ncbi:hypothetical protein ACFQ46_00845 [Kineococcus sp. GCM10028916]|uniref:hypothetical protein n=1 Tax=Kineococcus sp. GCM10028916 TaxID=3273394 RepID=UPI00363DCFBF